MRTENMADKLQNIMPPALIAPCGMNCGLCRAFIRDRDPCPGCRGDDTLKLKSRANCPIKTCDRIIRSGTGYCLSSECFPCSRLKSLDKRYRTKYGMSMIDNLEAIRSLGIRQFSKNEDERWLCPECGKTICVHASRCLSCGYQWRPDKRKPGNKVVPRITTREIQERLKALGDPRHAAILQRFFKTGPGEYGEGDRFVGMRVPEVRKLAQEYRALPVAEALRLLQSPIHEARLLALLILVHAFTRGDGPLREQIFVAYLANTRFINNWDLVDISASPIIGAHLQDDSGEVLSALAGSAILWERRIAVMATFHGTKRGEFGGTLRIAEVLLSDPEDLIHKAVGWMLREVGKRERPVLESFLKSRYMTMPRTMLRYAIERFPEELRQQYLRGEIEAGIP